MATTTPRADSPISRVCRRQATVAVVFALLPVLLLAVCSAWLLLDFAPRLVPGGDDTSHAADDSNSAASRLAGGVLLSQSISCFLLLLPLLSDCTSSKKNEVNKFVRTISVHTSRAASVCLGLTGLTMVVIGLIFHSQQDLSSIRLLIAGVMVTVLTCASLMASFWPFVDSNDNNNRSSINSSNVNRNNSAPEEEIIFSSSQDELNPLRASFSATELNESGSADPEGYRLLEDDERDDDEEALVTQETGGNDDDDDDDEADEEESAPVEDEEGETDVAATSTSRLRGTRRLLQLAAPQVLYLYAGCAILLVRLPFSLSIPHFVAST
jgi:hypothetical protein